MGRRSWRRLGWCMKHSFSSTPQSRISKRAPNGQYSGDRSSRLARWTSCPYLNIPPSGKTSMIGMGMGCVTYSMIDMRIRSRPQSISLFSERSKARSRPRSGRLSTLSWERQSWETWTCWCNSSPCSASAHWETSPLVSMKRAICCSSWPPRLF